MSEDVMIAIGVTSAPWLALVLFLSQWLRSSRDDLRYESNAYRAAIKDRDAALEQVREQVMKRKQSDQHATKMVLAYSTIHAELAKYLTPEEIAQKLVPKTQTGATSAVVSAANHRP